MSAKPSLWHETGWVRHNGTRCPVSPETIVQPWFGFGCGKYEYEAGKLNWSGFNSLTRVAGYRIVEEPE